MNFKFVCRKISVISQVKNEENLKMMMEQDLEISIRPRRNRMQPCVRALLQETHLLPQELIAPLFVSDGLKKKEAISSMPDVFRYSCDQVLSHIEELQRAGVGIVNLFCHMSADKKDPFGTEATKRENLLQQAIAMIKREFPEVCIMADIALDPFTDHGHDGILNEDGIVRNDETILQLCQMALRAAEAGVDFISPSDMMDGRVKVLRKSLDLHRFHNVGILSYAAKFASCFYGPFRDVLESNLTIGDKKNYQVNPANAKEALFECLLDEQEGADMLLIKPALTNLDIISNVSQKTNIPVGAYQVSGEYCMIKAAAQNGWLDEMKAFEESLLCIKRAGAKFIITYAALAVARHLQ